MTINRGLLAFSQSPAYQFTVIAGCYGRLKIEYYWSGSLVPAKTTVSGLKSGMTDMANVNPDYQPGKLPLMGAASLPGISQDYWTTCMALRDLMKMPEIADELDAQNIMYLGNVTNIANHVRFGKA